MKKKVKPRKEELTAKRRAVMGVLARQEVAVTAHMIVTELKLTGDTASHAVSRLLMPLRDLGHVLADKQTTAKSAIIHYHITQSGLAFLAGGCEMPVKPRREPRPPVNTRMFEPKPLTKPLNLWRTNAQIMANGVAL